jgi:hypothetical protein
LLCNPLHFIFALASLESSVFLPTLFLVTTIYVLSEWEPIIYNHKTNGKITIMHIIFSVAGNRWGNISFLIEYYLESPEFLLSSISPRTLVFKITVFWDVTPCSVA